MRPWGACGRPSSSCPFLLWARARLKLTGTFKRGSLDPSPQHNSCEAEWDGRRGQGRGWRARRKAPWVWNEHGRACRRTAGKQHAGPAGAKPASWRVRFPQTAVFPGMTWAPSTKWEHPDGLQTPGCVLSNVFENKGHLRRQDSGDGRGAKQAPLFSETQSSRVTPETGP